MHLEKKTGLRCTFPLRKEINVVKVCFTMRYSSGKSSNDKVITTAYNFWRQIACSFQVMSGNVLFLGNNIFEIPPFFQTQPGDLGRKIHACSLRFSALKSWTGSNFGQPRSQGRLVFPSPSWITIRPWGWGWFKPWGTRFDFLWGAVTIHAVGVGVAVGWVEDFTILSRQQADGMAKSGTAEGEGLLLLLLGFVFYRSL